MSRCFPVSLLVFCVLACCAWRWRARRHLRLEERRREREAERRRIARVLHDSFLQRLQLLVWQLQRHADALPRRGTDREEQAALAAIVAATEASIHEGRDLIVGLRQPPAAALSARLRALGDALSGPGSVRFVCDVEAAADVLTDAQADEVFMILAEAIGNACRHARAREIVVAGRARGRAVRFTVLDDGIGIAPAALRENIPGHVGLRGMAERAALLKADLHIAPGVGGGTAVRLDVPGGRRARAWATAFGPVPQR
jgi:signal transduction histidine kinase